MPDNEKKKRMTISPLNVAIATLLANITPGAAGSVDLSNQPDTSTNANLDQEDEEYNNTLTLDSTDMENEGSDRSSYHYSHRSHSSHASHRSHYSGR